MPYKILACGSNGNFQLGTGDDADTDTLREISVENASKPVQFAFGGNHTLILFEDGQVHACGDNSWGQCGIQKKEVVRSFTKVPGKFSKIAAGWEFSVLLSGDGKLYSCGHGPKGELGLGESVTDATSLTRVELPKGVKASDIAEIKASISHVLAKTSDGKFVGWGASRKGQLGEMEYQKTNRGQNKPIGQLWTPRIVEFSGSQYCMGRDRTIVAKVRRRGEKVLGMSGDDSANGDEIGVEEQETKIGIGIFGKDPEYIDCAPLTVKAMWSSVHYTQTGQNGVEIISKGNNLHGQLYNFTAQSPIAAFEVGSEHGLVLLADNTVYAWGWGEHGNCGRKQRESVTFDYLNLIYSEQEKVVGLACGLATTWLVTET